MGDTTNCSTPCHWGWLGKKFLGLTVIVWLVFFALLPHTAHGVAWTVNGLSGLWGSGERFIAPDRGGPRAGARPRAAAPDAE